MEGSLYHIIQSGQELHYSHILQIAIDTVDGMVTCTLLSWSGGVSGTCTART